MLTIPVKLLTPYAQMPSRQHAYDAGWDITAVGIDRVPARALLEDTVLKSVERDVDDGCSDFIDHHLWLDQCVYKIHTGLAMAIPPGYWGMLCARSSIYKKGVWQCNAPGIIDSGFRNEVCFMVYAFESRRTISMLMEQERIAQFLLMPALTTEYEFVEVDELPPSPDGRGEGGFGSTGK